MNTLAQMSLEERELVSVTDAFGEFLSFLWCIPIRYVLRGSRNKVIHARCGEFPAPFLRQVFVAELFQYAVQFSFIESPLRIRFEMARRFEPRWVRHCKEKMLFDEYVPNEQLGSGCALPLICVNVKELKHRIVASPQYCGTVQQPNVRRLQTKSVDRPKSVCDPLCEQTRSLAKDIITSGLLNAPDHSFAEGQDTLVEFDHSCNSSFDLPVSESVTSLGHDLLPVGSLCVTKEISNPCTIIFAHCFPRHFNNRSISLPLQTNGLADQSHKTCHYAVFAAAVYPFS